MLPIPQAYVGSLCEVKSLDNNMLAVGRIIKIDNEALEVAAGEDEFMQLIQFRLPVKIFVYNSRLGDQIMVGITYLSTDRFVRLEEIKPLQDFERRGAFRVNSGVPGRMYQLMTDEERAAFDERVQNAGPEEAEQLLAQAYIEVKVVDVSLTGVRLSCERALRAGERYCVDFTPLNTAMTFCVRVERIIRMPDGTQQYGCSYFDISERQLDLLCRDLFQLQRLEKNRRRNSLVEA